MSVCMVVSLTLLAVLFDIAYAQASLQHNACSSAYRRAHMHTYIYSLYICTYDCCGCNFLEKVLAKMARECQARGRAEIYAAVLEYAG